MRSLKQFLRDWLDVAELERENIELKQMLRAQETRINRQAQRVTDRITELDRLTVMDADIGVRGPCTVILSGVYRGKGYVSFYEIEHDDFRRIVEDYRERRRHGHLRNLDSIPGYRGGAFEL